MNSQEYIVRDATLNEFPEIGELMVNVYSQLEGFPTKKEQPNYYKMLANIAKKDNRNFKDTRSIHKR